MDIKISNSQLRKYAKFQILDHFLGREKAYNLTLNSRRKFYTNLENNLKEKAKED